jgi:uncharacterized protein (TIGR03437 family)
LTVNGTGFVSNSQVNFDGNAKPTTFVSATQLKAQIDAADIIGVGQAAVTVVNPAPGGGTSNVSTFTIVVGNAPVPVLTNISPNTIGAGAATFALVATGSSFVPTSVVKWTANNTTTNLATAYGSPTQLTAQVPANLVAAAGSAQVTVFTPAPGGGTSATQTFTITPTTNNPVPTITSLSPPAVGAGSAGFTLVVNGTNFVNGATARINNNARSTNVISATQLNVSILAGDVTSVGNLAVTALNPAPGGGTSNAVNLVVSPVVTSTNAASFSAAQMAPESIIAAFGTGMATGVQVASTVPLPTNLGGTTVKVIDSANISRDAALFFVAPLQVNFQAPPGTAEGVARVIVQLNGNIVDAGTINITKVAPGMFSASADGTGVASALVLRFNAANPGGVYEPVARYDAGQGKFVPIQIDMGPATDTLYLILYGTGLRSRTNAGNVLITLDSLPQRPLNPADFEDCFAAPGFVGLDQCNIKLPRTLIGKGLINVTLTVDGKISNTIQLLFK